MQVCAVCGAAFGPRRGGGKYCSAACSRKHHRSLEQAKRATARRARGAVKLGAHFDCQKCGAETIANSPKSRFCAACRLIARRETFRRSNNREEKKAQDRLRRKLDYRLAVSERMSWAIWHALKTRKGGRSWEELVGYSLDELVRHIERQFTLGMNWQNMGEWHVDHIVPRSTFKFSSYGDPEFRACWALTNLRPLWAKDNLKKSARRLYLL